MGKRTKIYIFSYYKKFYFGPDKLVLEGDFKKKKKKFIIQLEYFVIGCKI